MTIIETHMEMCFYTIILYLQGNEIRNKQFSISFAEAKLKEKCCILFFWLCYVTKTKQKNSGVPETNNGSKSKKSANN